jgi:type IX secretion system PorP/SprF family membrane protein
MKCLIKIILLLFILPFGFVTKAQDPHFTQYFSNPLALNPAFTGSVGCSRIAVNARDNWARMLGSYYTTSISYDQYVHPIRSGLGFNYIFDNSENIRYRHSADFFYSYNIKIGKNSILRPAINIGLGAKFLYWKRIPFYEGFILLDGIPPFIDGPLPDHFTKYYFNIGAGLLFTHNNFVVGFAADHLNRPDEGYISLSRMPIKYTIHSSFQVNIKKIASITPAIIYQKQKDFEQMQVAVLCKVWYINSGIGARFNTIRGIWEYAFGMLGFQNNWMSISYNYDFTTSKLTETTGGAHELSMMYKFNCKNKTDKFHIPQINGF